MTALAYLAGAGTFDTPRLYAFLGVGFVGAIATAIYTYRIPELANSRGKFHEGTKKWDYFLVIPYILIIILVIPFTAGLDTVRYQWSSMDNGSFFIGVLLYVGSTILVQWCMLTNQYFEGTVRIQEERNHRVITEGPYRIVRHPGYVGMIITGLSLVLMLGSYAAFIPLALSMIILVARTALEDETLMSELTGYREYSEQTRYRLIPLLW